MFWQKCRAASNSTLHLIELDTLPTFDRAGDGHQSSHSRNAVFHISALLRLSVQDCVRESFDLTLVTVRIFAEWTMELPILRREALDIARLVKPGQIDMPLHAARLAVNLKTFFKVAPDRNCQVKMAHRAAGIFQLDKPAIGAKLFSQPGPQRCNLSSEIAGRVRQMASVRQQKIAAVI